MKLRVGVVLVKGRMGWLVAALGRVVWILVVMVALAGCRMDARTLWKLRVQGGLDGVREV